MAVRVSEQKVIGRGATVYGQTVTIFKVGYSEDVPGVGRETFAVSVTGREGEAPFTAGFVNLQDARKFLHSVGDETFVTHTADGQEREETRHCLGIPKGMVSEIDGETITVPSPPATTAVLDEPNNTVSTEQNPEVVSNDTAAKDTGKSSGSSKASGSKK